MNMMNNGTGNVGGGGNGFFPWFFGRDEENDNQESEKISHDVYHVYVNGDYVGDRISLAQGDGGWQAIDDYLKGKNFEGYRVTREGDRVYVEVKDENQKESIREHLKVYTELR